MYFVYAISSINRNYIYVGLTANIKERFKQHNLGYEKTTKPQSPFILIYSETFEGSPSVRIREKYWKSGLGKEHLRALKNQFVI